MKKNSILRGLLIVMFLLISAISLAEVKISGNFDIWIGNSSRSKPTKSVGNMDDNRFLERPFVINNKGYSFLMDGYGNKLLLRVAFDSRGNVIQEDIYETYRFTENCLAVKGQDKFCFTINADGYPAIWNRYQSKYSYYGRFINNVKINNPFNTRYDNYDNIFEF